MNLDIYDIVDNQSLSFSNEDKNILLNIQNNSVLELHLLNGKYNIFIDINPKQTIEYTEDITVKNADVNIMYISLNKQGIKQISNYHLFENSNINLLSSILAFSDKTIEFNCVHKGKHSFANLDSSCIIGQNGFLNIKVLGHILSGQIGSGHHQKTRCLTIGEINQAHAQPLLVIDENDVTASHALSLGTIDPEQLFYLQTRGLSFEDSIKLLFESYLIKDLDFIHDQNIVDYIREKVSKKVENL